MPVIEVQGLRKSYGNKDAVTDVSFAVQEGEIFGLLGPNGAGKTTTVECIEGIRAPSDGHIEVLGLDPIRERTRLRHVLGVQLQHGILPDDLRIIEAVKLYRSFYENGSDPENLLTKLGLSQKRNERFKNLSGGQAQRLSIALALIANPRIVVLDELTTGLDPQARRGVWGLVEEIRNSGVTVLLVSHVMEEAERLCDRVAIIDQGKIIAQDSPAGLIAQVEGATRVRLRTEEDFDTRILTEIDGVLEVEKEQDEIVVSGRGNLLREVNSILGQHHVTVTDAHLERASLEDAFLSLIGTPFKSGDAEATEEARP